MSDTRPHGCAFRWESQGGITGHWCSSFDLVQGPELLLKSFTNFKKIDKPCQSNKGLGRGAEDMVPSNLSLSILSMCLWQFHVYLALTDFRCLSPHFENAVLLICFSIYKSLTMTCFSLRYRFVLSLSLFFWAVFELLFACCWEQTPNTQS